MDNRTKDSYIRVCAYGHMHEPSAVKKSNQYIGKKHVPVSFSAIKPVCRKPGNPYRATRAASGAAAPFGRAEGQTPQCKTLQKGGKALSCLSRETASRQKAMQKKRILCPACPGKPNLTIWMQHIYRISSGISAVQFSFSPPRNLSSAVFMTLRSSFTKDSISSSLDTGSSRAKAFPSR